MELYRQMCAGNSASATSSTNDYDSGTARRRVHVSPRSWEPRTTGDVAGVPHDADPACRRRRGFRVRRGSWRIPRGWIAPLAAALAGATPLLAQNQEPVVEVVFENDALIGVVPGVPNSDREYTHGLAVAVDVRGAPLWGRAFPKLRPCTTPVPGRFTCARTRFEGGQKIFTPDYKRRFESPQRPYAAWLYGAVTGRAVSASLDRS